jgi:peptidoglycan/xylan/chitin deacetylase (PgdA/CDA1 family)
MLGQAQVELHLAEKVPKYVPLALALAGQGDALTVDDATYAGLQAVLLARRNGHHVTWFVNGWNVEENVPYFPFQISCMLDHSRKSECVFLGRRWRLESLVERRELRRVLKQKYLRASPVEQIFQLLGRLSKTLQASPQSLTPELMTVQRADIELAAREGVSIQNHGWTHINPKLLTEHRFKIELGTNHDWIRNISFEAPTFYAPPFGLLGAGAVPLSYGVLLADRAMPDFNGSKSITNRCDLILSHPVVTETCR